MFKHFVFILVICSSFYSKVGVAQSTVKTEVITYNDSVPNYYLDFNNQNVRFNWDTISKSKNLMSTRFYIKNTSDKDIKIINTDFRNNNISFYGERNRTLKPGGFYEVKCQFYVGHYHRRLHERIKINYVNDTDTSIYLIHTYGFFKPIKNVSKYVKPKVENNFTIYSRLKNEDYIYEITNKNNVFDWGTVGLKDSTDMQYLKLKNTTNDTVYIRSINMAYHKVFVAGDLNGQKIENKTDVNFPLYPGESLVLNTRILGIDEPIYKFTYPNYVEVIFVLNNERHKFRLKNVANGKGKEIKKPQKEVETTETIQITTIDKSDGEKYNQKYSKKKQHYYFNFSDANQSIDWGEITVSPELDSTVFLIENTTGKDITVTRTTLNNNFTNWSLSKKITIKPNAFYEVKPHFYSINYTNEKLSYPLIIDYTSGDKQYKLIIHTSVSGIRKPDNTKDVERLKRYETNRAIKVNDISQIRNTDLINYDFDFNETNYGFFWGDFRPKVNNVVNFRFTNNSEDTIFISQMNNPILNFKTKGIIGKRTIENRSYYYEAVPPHQKMIVSLSAEATTNRTFKFPFHLHIKYFQNGERKVMRVINSGTFLKSEPVYTATLPKPKVIELVKPVLEKNFTLQLSTPNHNEIIEDLSFIRWVDGETETYKPQDNQVTLLVKDRALIYGMFYSEKYGVISKFYHQVKYTHKPEGLIKTVAVRHLFIDRNQYYYGGHDMSKIKQPYKLEKKGYYRLVWTMSKNDDRKQVRSNIRAYLRSLGYSGGSFLYEPNLSKAIQLERTLKNSKYHIEMESVIWHHPLTEQGWNGGYKVYSNYFEIKFWPEVSEKWIKAMFTKYQITTYSKHNQVYIFKFKYIISRSYMRIMDKLWMKKEVLYLKQHTTGAADLD